MLDITTHVKTQEISPESENVLVVSEERVTYKAGGAANVAMNLKSLGADVHLVTVGAADKPFDQLRSILDAAKLSYTVMTPQYGIFTTTKHRIRTKDGQLLRIDKQIDRDRADGLIGASLDHETRDRLCNYLPDELLADTSLLILSDYGKGVLSKEVCSAWISRAEELGIPVLVDPYRADDWKKFSSDMVILKPNEKQLRTYLRDAKDHKYDTEASLRDAKRRLAEWGLRTHSLWATLGAGGMAIYTDFLAGGEYCSTSHATPVEVFDVTGAGDTSIATMAYYLVTQEASPAQLVDWKTRLWSGMELANIAGGISVTRLGVYCITHEDLLVHQSCEIATEPSKRIQEAIRSGKLVVFTNGCFDLLHAGHVSLLWQAKTLEWCPEDYKRLSEELGLSSPSIRGVAENVFLVVGVDSDASVSHLKSTPEASRPIQDERTRYCALRSLKFVDEVILFHADCLPDPPSDWQDTRLRTMALSDLIRLIKPNVLIKGAEYASTPYREIPGAEFIQSCGGEVLFPPQMLSISTTEKAKARDKASQ
jgi:D-beta-D-heptose 7-phosphate kinase/D-beta-D-heptose 1-phosphate adenosyltransferase